MLGLRGSEVVCAAHGRIQIIDELALGMRRSLRIAYNVHEQDMSNFRSLALFGSKASRLRDIRG